jgi:hypothetical protein
MPIGIDTIAEVSLGTGTAKTLITPTAGYFLPAEAKEIIAICPFLWELTQTAGQQVYATTIVESDDLPIAPFEAPAAPIGSLLGATSDGLVAKAERWPIYQPVAGGENVRVYGQAKIANTVAPQMEVAMVFSDQRTKIPNVHRKVGSLLTASASADTEVIDTSPITITNGSRLIEVYGVSTQATVVASNPLTGRCKIVSSDLTPPFPLLFPFATVGSGLSTLIQQFIPGIERWAIDRTLPNGRVANLTDSVITGQATSAFSTQIGVGYI